MIPDNSVKRFPRSIIEAFGGADPDVLTHPMSGEPPRGLRFEEKAAQLARKTGRRLASAGRRAIIIIAGH